jgi:uncharacterized RDD family membrane protein YckC
MHCSTCGAPLGASDKFCQKCGALAQLSAGTGAGIPVPAQNIAITAAAGQPEDKGRRVGAFLIDIVPAIILAALNLLPLVGHFVSSTVIAAYWLLRDINEASPGKMVLGSRVVSANGSPATTGQKIGRNITLALPGLISAIPLGFLFAIPLALLFFFTEVVMLLVTGNRLGDKLAGTTVVRR